MREEDIEKYIYLLNDGGDPELIFIKQIGENVEVAKIWLKEPNMSDNIIGNFYPERFFFIKNKDGKYVGAVLDMFSDLHWFILKEHRKQGFLIKALSKVILPYLFYERDKQSLSININQIGEENYLNSKAIALKLGFKSTDKFDSEFELLKSEFDWQHEELVETSDRITEERMNILRKRAFYAFKILQRISDELMMTYDDDNELSEIASEVRNYTWKIEDLGFKYGIKRDVK
jgi:hypothetical protein